MGGMAVDSEGGRMRTSGGVFLKLLRESSELPRQAADAAWDRIKRKGAEAKATKAKATARRRGQWISQRASSPATPRSVMSGVRRAQSVRSSPLKMGRQPSFETKA